MIRLATGLALLLIFALAGAAEAQSVPGIDRRFIRQAESPEDVVTTLEIVLLLTVLTLAPAILVMMTSFTRIVIVLSFVRRALATQELPPTQVIIGLALILTTMVMMPTLVEIKDQALVPYIDGEISQKAAFERSLKPIRVFMFKHVHKQDLRLFIDIEQQALPLEKRKLPATADDVGTHLLVAAFSISELKRSFEMGFLLYLPFLIIDLVIASVLISMGMLVLPPILVSMPFKILLFVLVDGWHLIVGEIVGSFQT